MNEVAKQEKRPSVLATMAARFGVDENKMLDCIKATAFKGGCTNEQLMALCIVTEQYKLNPWTKEIYAFPDKNNGIVPVVGVDGWARIVNEHPQFDGVQFSDSEDGSACTCTIYRKDRAHATSVTEYLKECSRNTQPWTSHPRRMLRHKAFVQAARLAFGFAGIYDADDAEVIVAATSVSDAPYARKQTASQLLGGAKKPDPADAPETTENPKDDGAAEEDPAQ